MREKELIENEDYILKPFDVFEPAEHPKEFKSLSPFGKVPVLAHGDLGIYETSAITRYLDQIFPSPSLQPTSPSSLARMNQVISIVDNYAYPILIWKIFVERISAPEEGRECNYQLVEQAHSEAMECLAALEDLIDFNGFLFGKALSLADCYMMPIFVYFMLTPEGKDSLSEFPNIHRWWLAVKQRPSLLKTRSKWG